MRLLLILTISFLAISSTFAKAHRMGASLLFGNHFRYGGDYASLNAPQGIHKLSATTDSVAGTAFNQANGLSIEGQVRYILQNKFFASLGGFYTGGTKVSGKYPLREPISGSIYQLNGTTEVATEGSAKMSHFGFPLTLGLVITFWNELRVYAGGGAAYVFTNLQTSQKTVDASVIDFEVNLSVKPSFLSYHALIMGEYIIFGDAEGSTKIAVNAGLKIMQGQSAITNGGSGTIPTVTPDFPLVEKDAAKVDVSGYQIFFGLTYFFLEK